MKKCALFLSAAFCLSILSACSKAEQNYAPIRKEFLSDTQQYFVDLAEIFDLVLLEISEEVTEEEKHRFFCWYLSDADYAQQLEQWSRDGIYYIPLEEMERIIFTHLDTDTLDLSQEVWSRYNSVTKEYEAVNIGGYGGVRFNETIGYSIEGDLHHVTLGTFDPENETELLGRYDVVFEVSDIPEEYRVLSAKNTAITKDKEKRRAYLG